MAQFHFVEDYERHVAALKAAHPLDEAMSLAVGGSFERIGKIQADILTHFGLKDGMSLVDLGCGSGRTAKAVSERLKIDYLGLDIIQDLLDYAASVCPPSYRFKLNRQLAVPAPDDSADMACAFSLFTHLLHEETFIYLTDIHRALKPGGKLVLSFLEFAMPSHWAVFEMTIEAQKSSSKPHLNMFFERNQLEAWAQHIGFKGVEFVNGDAPIFNGEYLGQSIAVLTK